METCQHKTGITLFEVDGIYIVQCTYGCGRISVETCDENGDGTTYDVMEKLTALRTENERLREAFVNFVDYTLEVGEFALPGKSHHPLIVEARKHKKDLAEYREI